MTYDKIRFYTKASLDSNFLQQTYVQPKQIMFRLFRIEEEVTDELKSDTNIEESQLWTNDDLRGGKLSYNGKSYICIYNKVAECCEYLFDSYREVYACYALPISESFSQQDKMFFADRLGETFFSKGKNKHWSKHIKATRCQYLYRFLFEPGKDLTNAAVVCMQDYPLLTNIEFDISKEYYYEHLDLLDPWAAAHKPVVSIEGPDTIAPNETATFTLNITKSDGSQNLDDYVYEIECKQGYAPNTEVKVVDGKGTFKIMALGLEEGETLRFKINDKVWTSYAEKQLTVIANK